MVVSLPIANLETATFECIFGRGCEGICCKNGRPSVDEEEQKRVQKNLKKILPHLRPEAKDLVENEGFTSNRKKLGLPMLRVVDGWCVFFNKGCVLHKVGATEGDAYQYKPSQCALFPLERKPDGEWYIRQWDYNNEAWDLFCLNPKASNKPAAESLRDEIQLAEKFSE